MLKRCALIVCLTAFAAAIGCGSKSQTPVELSGTVKYKGQLLKGGYMAFHTDNHGVVGTTINPDGSYTVKLPTDSMKVTIETESFNPDKTAPVYGPETAGGRKAAVKGAPPGGEGKLKSERMQAEGRGGEEAGGFGPPPKEELAKLYTKIPQKYAFKETSGFSLQLEAGKHSKDFELTD